MEQFEYLAVSGSGQSVNGLALAGNLLELDRVLEGRGLTLTSAKKARASSLKVGKPLSSTELVFFTTQLATLLSAGVPMLAGLRGIASRMPSKHGSELIQRMVVRLENGSGLTEAMASESKSFPMVFRECVRAGELSGSLPEVLVRQAKFLQWARSIRVTTMQALIYPAMLVVALIGLILVLLTFVLPRLMQMFPGGREALPLPTRFVMACSDFLVGNALLLVLGAGVALAGIVLARRSPLLRKRLSKRVLGIPRYGKLVGMIATSRFASTAATLQSAGCDIGTVLDVAGSTCGNAHMEGGFLEVGKQVRRGRAITESLEELGGVDPLLIQMTHIGESSGDLAGCLRQLADYYDEEVPRAVKWFLALLEPTILIVAGGVVAFILLATLLPIFSLYEAVG